MINLSTFFVKFDSPETEPKTEPVAATEMPEPYRTLLAHGEHMTVTVERFHGDAVDVQVLESHIYGRLYVRKILLLLRQSRRVVQFGAVEVDLDCLPAAASEEILSERKPLGRVLIEHDVLRSIEPIGFFRTTWLQSWSRTATSSTYGRLGIIWSGGKQAVRVAEILTPIEH